MTDRLEQSIDYIELEEGGFTSRPDEPGGGGNHGVSLDALRANWRKHGRDNPSIDDLRRLTEAEARALYREDYAAPIRFRELPPGVDYVMLDAAVTLGITGAGQLLHHVLGSDGSRVDDLTLAAVRSISDVEGLIDDLCDAWIEKKQQSKSWPKYKHGWTKRNVNVRARAHAMEKIPG